MALGIITGRRIGKNRDGNQDRVILQVEISADDVQTVELFTQAGEDTNPADGCRVNIIPVSDSYKIGVGVSDGLTPEVDPGEKEIYSTDDPVTVKKARIKLNKDGDIIIDADGGAEVEIKNDGDIILNSGTGSALKYTELDTALQLLVVAINAALATKLDGVGAPGAVVLDISASEVPEVKL
jgi:hypothetical protein